MKAIATASRLMELREFDPKSLPEWAEEFSEFLLFTGQQHGDVKRKCTLIKKSFKKKSLWWKVKTAMKRSSNWGDFLKRLEHMYRFHDTDLIFCTDI